MGVGLHEAGARGEGGRELTEVDLEAKKIARYDLGIYECSLGHRAYFLLEPK